VIRKSGLFIMTMFTAGVLAFSSVRAEELDPDYIIDRPEYQDGSPWYQTATSSWSFGFRAGVNRFPAPRANGDLYQLTWDWILPWQSIGAFSIGPNLALFNPELTPAAISSSPLNLMAGVTLRYQAKWFLNQPVVPTASVAWNYHRLKSAFVVAPYATGSGVSVAAGLLLHLGWIDRHTAKEAFQSLGMTRAYLSLELEKTNFQNQVFSLDALFYLFGVRFEFE
jgi:hypothetical protein